MTWLMEILNIYSDKILSGKTFNSVKNPRYD